MLGFINSIFVKITSVVTTVFIAVGLVSAPTPPQTPVLTKLAIDTEVSVTEKIVKVKPDPVAEELRQLRRELASLKSEKTQPSQQATNIPHSTASIVSNIATNDIVARSNPNQPVALSLSGPDILKEVGPATIFILTDVGCGTGFIIDKTGLALTNAHVIKDKKNFQISFANGIKTNAELVGMDGLNDLALIKINGNNLPFLDLGSSDPYAVSAGDDIFAVGYPGIADLATCKRGQELTIVKGIINARRIISAIEYFQIDALIQSGNSGGPLVNKYGQVVGINTRGYLDKEGFSRGVNFALTINLAKDLLPKLKRGLFVPVLPAFGSDVEIPKNVKLRADSLVDLDCAVFLGGELARYIHVCELYKQYPNEYNWLLVD